MNDILFYTLLIALTYYFLVYLPQQRKLNKATKPFTFSQSTQTTADWNSLLTKNQQLVNQVEYYRNLTNDNSELKQALNSLLLNLKTLNKTI